MLKTGISPHIHANTSVEKAMWNVSLALMPALLASVYFFGMRAFWLCVFSALTAALSELLMQVILRRKITLSDGSAVLTGILVAFNMPPGVPFIVPIVGSAFAIIIVKQLFGGLGNNIFNPALAGRVFVMFAWTMDMTAWNVPLDPAWLQNFNFFSFNLDTVTAATPLAVVKLDGIDKLISAFTGKSDMYWHLFIGNVGGSLGETSALALLIGALYLMVRRVLIPVVPVIYIGTVALIAALTGHDPLFYILSGGLMLGALFMATDYVTSPFLPMGMLIYGLGCGLLTALLRLKGGMPEGVSFSILMMNALTPLIDRYTKTKLYGARKK